MPTPFDIAKRRSSGLAHFSTPNCLVLLPLSFIAPTHLCLTFFRVCPRLFDTLSTTPSPFDVAKASNNAQTSWDAFLPSLLTRSAAPLPCFTHPPLFDAPTTFRPLWFVLPTRSPFGVAKQRSSGLGRIPPPLLPRSAAPLLCFTHRPPFDTPTTFPPPLIHFAHPIHV